jgi:hypothetical protein
MNSKKIVCVRFRSFPSAQAVRIVLAHPPSDLTARAASHVESSHLRVIKIIDKASIKIIDVRFHGSTSTGGLFSVCSGLGSPPPQ